MDVEAGMNTEMDPGDIANRYKLRISAYLEISGQRGRNAQEPWMSRLEHAQLIRTSVTTSGSSGIYGKLILWF